MTKEECLEECREMIDYGADSVEIFEFVEDNTDLDPIEIVAELF